jgi:hypothetical protein
VNVGVGVIVLVTISGVRLRVGEGVVPVMVTEGVGVTRVSGARERAIKPTQ